MENFACGVQKHLFERYCGFKSVRIWKIVSKGDENLEVFGKVKNTEKVLRV